MEYDMILVPGCEMLRSSTLERLEDFVKAGGKLVFAGDIATLEDAKASNRALKLAQNAKQVQFNRGTILEAVEEVRQIELRNESGAMTNNLIYQLRQDGDGKWLFLAHAKEPRNKFISEKQKITIRVKGAWSAVLYDTITGEKQEVEQCIKGNTTDISI